VFSPSSLLTFLRRFAIALLVVVVVAVGGIATGRAYKQRKFDESRTVHIDPRLLTPQKAGQPANFLLLGSDSRAFVDNAAEAKAFGTSADTGGQRSDVMMVLHVEPATKTGIVVSFPRDLVVDIPGHGLNLLNAAYDFGGPNLLIQTFKQDFHLDINHYLEVDFAGFRNIVNAIGHIHIFFPTPVNDEFSGLHILKAGCASLNGDEALAYARSRHYNIPDNLQNPAPWQPTGKYKQSRGWTEDPLADLDRIPRQQYFLRTISQAAIHNTGSNVFGLNSLLDAVFKDFGHDQTLKLDQLDELALTFRDLKPNKVQMLTLPWKASPYPQFSAQVVPLYPDATTVLNRLAQFPIPTPAIPRPWPASTVKVRVVNGSGVKNAGKNALAQLVAAGFRSAGPAVDADNQNYTRTQVIYAPGKFSEGFTTAYALGTQNLGQALSAKNTLGGDVLVIVGKDYPTLPTNFKGLPKASTTTTATTGSGGSTAPTSSTTTSTTTTTLVPQRTPDTLYVPVDPKTGGPLVGCPSK